MTGLDGIIGLLACPHCNRGIDRYPDGAVGCPAGHRFDVARQGYLSLLGNRSRTDTGDTADMVAARVGFLGAGHYRPIADEIAGSIGAGPALDIGAGTGYYLAAVLDRLAAAAADAAAPTDAARTGAAFSDAAPTAAAPDPVGIALDASRYAARRAASAHPHIGSVVADAWSPLPVREEAVATVLSVFAPRDPAEIGRVLRPAGRLVTVTPEPEHLAEIRSKLTLLTVDPGKPDRLVEAFDGILTPAGRVEIRREMALTRDDVRALAWMGPAARHLRTDDLRVAVGRLPEVTRVTLAVTVSVFQRC